MGHVEDLANHTVSILHEGKMANKNKNVGDFEDFEIFVGILRVHS